MNDDDAKDPRESTFVRWAAGIGDLGNPFYGEERRRDVWNEASAVGLQLVLWTGMVAAAAMVWIGGADALPYGLTLLILLGAVSWVVIDYAARLGVRFDEGTRLLRRRMLPALVPLLAFAAGVWHTGVVDGALGWGVAVGAVVGLLAGVLGLRRARRVAQA
jgi:hypothetical protein